MMYESAPPDVVIAELDPRPSGSLLAITEVRDVRERTARRRHRPARPTAVRFTSGDHRRCMMYESAPPDVVIAQLDPRLSGLLLAITDGA
jgi:hypothetical protein